MPCTCNSKLALNLFPLDAQKLSFKKETNPSTLPKQWNNGGGQATTSPTHRPILIPIEYPLFRMLLCVRHAALGALVVPEVNCMLIMSSTCNGASVLILTDTWDESLCSGSKRLENGVATGKSEQGKVPEELSTRTSDFSEGTASDRMFSGDDEVSETSSCRSDLFDLRGLYGSLVVVLMIRWPAVR
jgi:hypothetical protein